jgi:multicomponent K+:H+ antiporter subunit C
VIFFVGRVVTSAPAVMRASETVLPADAANPLPQALVLTAIVIGFATTALFLVVLLASRGLAGNDHVDGADGTP